MIPIFDKIRGDIATIERVLSEFKVLANQKKDFLIFEKVIIDKFFIALKSVNIGDFYRRLTSTLCYVLGVHIAFFIVRFYLSSKVLFIV
jgi:uncharacterized protein (DUF427 family)